VGPQGQVAGNMFANNQLMHQCCSLQSSLAGLFSCIYLYSSGLKGHGEEDCCLSTVAEWLLPCWSAKLVVYRKYWTKKDYMSNVRNAH
jgi:hypothetical protein